MHFIIRFACLLVLTTGLATETYGQIVGDDGELIITNGRIESLAAKLGNRPVAEITANRVKTIRGDGPGVWSYEWRLVGEYFESLADKQAQQGDKKNALINYYNALHLYNFAYLPDNFSTSERRAYGRFRDLMFKINEYLEYPFTVVNIPFEGKNIVVHLYRPDGVDTPPLVIYTGGTDGSKEQSRGASQALAARGIAVAAFDLAGTGESNDWLARPDSHKLHMRVLDWFEKTEDYDFERVGLIGGSFGGYYAIQMAADEPRLKAVINHCGLVHSAFEIPPEALNDALKSRTGPLLRSAMRRLGFDPDNMDIEAFAEFARTDPLSLLKRNVVGPNAKPILTPLLTVNGGQDAVAPLDDMKLVNDVAVNGEMWVLGQAPHCAPSHMETIYPEMMNWLEEKLNE